MKGLSEPPERREVTEEQRERARAAIEEAKRAVREAMKRPPVEIRSPGKFTEPLGLYEDGSFQPPLTEEEKAHNEEVRRRAREELRQAREAREAEPREAESRQAQAREPEAREPEAREPEEDEGSE